MRSLICYGCVKLILLIKENGKSIKFDEILGLSRIREYNYRFF